MLYCDFCSLSLFGICMMHRHPRRQTPLPKVHFYNTPPFKMKDLWGPYRIKRGTAQFFLAQWTPPLINCFEHHCYRPKTKCKVILLYWPILYCAAFMTGSFTVNMTIPTQPGTIPLLSVFGWIIIHQHVDDTLNWDLSWSDYKAGFKSIENNFWLGLENMHLLTSSQPYRLRTE